MNTEWSKNVCGEQIDALVETLKHFQIPDRCYTILGDRDESVCLNHEDGLWHVYFSGRDQKLGLKTTKEIKEACEYFLQEMGEGKSERQQMVEYFYDIVSKKETSNSLDS